MTDDESKLDFWINMTFDELKKKIGGKIKKWRQEHGMTQEELAHHLSVSFSSVSSWELGKRLPQKPMKKWIFSQCGLDIRKIENKWKEAQDYRKRHANKTIEEGMEENLRGKSRELKRIINGQ